MRERNKTERKKSDKETERHGETEKKKNMWNHYPETRNNRTKSHATVQSVPSNKWILVSIVSRSKVQNNKWWCHVRLQCSRMDCFPQPNRSVTLQTKWLSTKSQVM